MKYFVMVNSVKAYVCCTVLKNKLFHSHGEWLSLFMKPPVQSSL